MVNHAISEGFKNLIRSFWLSATAISVITISLASVAFISTVATSINFYIRQLDNQISILAPLKPGISPENIEKTRQDLQTIDGVKKDGVKYIDSATAQKELEGQSESFRNIIQFFNDNNTEVDLDYYLIQPTNSESYAKVYDSLKQDQYKDVIKEIWGSQEFITRLQSVYYWATVIGIAVFLVFTIISILVMMNILRMAVYNHKDEIEIMRLVGATNNYIRGPFIFEGAMYNIISAVIVIAIFIPVTNLLLPVFRDLFQITNSASLTNLLIQMYISLGAVTLVGIIAGSLTAFFATQRYLKL